MFLEKFVDNVYLKLIYSNYDAKFLNMLEEKNFLEIYNLLKNNNFYFIEDIILNYLEIFEMDYYDVYKGLKKLNKELGDNYVYIIGNNMSYLQKIIDINEED